MDRLTWLVEFLAGAVRWALGIAPAPRPAKTYALAYAVIPRRAQARPKGNR